MDSVLNLILMSLVAFTVPGILAWRLARREGLRVVWLQPDHGRAGHALRLVDRQSRYRPVTAGRHTLVIYFLLLPSFLSMVLGAVLGAWQHLMRSPA